MGNRIDTALYGIMIQSDGRGVAPREVIAEEYQWMVDEAIKQGFIDERPMLIITEKGRQRLKDRKDGE